MTLPLLSSLSPSRTAAPSRALDEPDLDSTRSPPARFLFPSPASPSTALGRRPPALSPLNARPCDRLDAALDHLYAALGQAGGQGGARAARDHACGRKPGVRGGARLAVLENAAGAGILSAKLKEDEVRRVSPPSTTAFESAKS